MELTKRQESILEIVKEEGPITGEQIAERLSINKATLRSDMAVLTMFGLLGARPRVGYFYLGHTLNRIMAEKLHQIKVGEIKSIPVVISDQAYVYDAVVKMFIEDVGTLIVVKERGLLEGVISRKDLLKTTLSSPDIQKLPVSVIMTRMPNIIMAEPGESVWLAAKKLIVHEIDALPVVRPVASANGKKGFEVIGRITKTSITRLLVELGEES
ncbi:MAG: helix-turn-helix transcriptional regulator [Peptococcaceae bacterium]